MGMFDFVKYEASCKKCGHVLKKGWQSKSGECELLELPASDVQNVYTICNKCQEWNEYHKAFDTLTQRYAFVLVENIQFID